MLIQEKQTKWSLTICNRQLGEGGGHDFFTKELEDTCDSLDATVARDMFCNYSCHSVEIPGISRQVTGRPTSNSSRKWTP